MVFSHGKSASLTSQPPGAREVSCSHPAQSAAVHAFAMLKFFEASTQLSSGPVRQHSVCSGWYGLHLGLA